MVKELIRNGGFERGNLDFWTYTNLTLSFDPGEVVRGDYTLKGVLTAAASGLLYTKDYIEVSPFETYLLSFNLRHVEALTCNVGYVTYDSDYNLIGAGEFLEPAIVGIAAAMDYSYYFAMNPVVAYIQIVFWWTGTEADRFFLDSVSLVELPASPLSARPISLLKLTNINADATAYSQEFFTGIWKQAEYHLYCTSLTGTTPTLNVTIQAQDPSTEQWKDILVFQELDAAGSEFKTLLSGLGWKQRAKFTTAGTVTDCDFTLGVVYKR